MLKRFGYLLSKNKVTRYFLSLIYDITIKFSCLYLKRTSFCIAFYVIRDQSSIVPGISDFDGLLIIQDGNIANRELQNKFKKLRFLSKLFPFLPFSSASLTILEESNLEVFKFIENFSDLRHPSDKWQLFFTKKTISKIPRATIDEMRGDYEVTNLIIKSHLSTKDFRDLRFLKKLEDHLNQYIKVNIMNFCNSPKIEIINQANKLLNQVLLAPKISVQNIKIDKYYQKTFKNFNIEIFNPLFDSFSIVLIDTAIMNPDVKDFFKIFFIFSEQLEESKLRTLNDILKQYPNIQRRSHLCSRTLFESIIYNSSSSEPLTNQTHSFSYTGLNLFPSELPQNCELFNFNLKRYLYRQKYRFLNNVGHEEFFNREGEYLRAEVNRIKAFVHLLKPSAIIKINEIESLNFIAPEKTIDFSDYILFRNVINRLIDNI